LLGHGIQLIGFVAQIIRRSLIAWWDESEEQWRAAV
jgi:hypothetical protein